MTDLPNKYDAHAEEKRLQEFWESEGTYRFDPESDKAIFSIDTPPPTVSGKMHMGHAFGNSQQDFIARYKRMKGFNVLQPFGTDDNGLPTQTLIQKMKKVSARQMGRTEFRKLCNETLQNELRPEYTSDWKRLGISCDFNVKYSTIDPHCQKISQKSFLDLYKAGRQYRREAPAMYCPKCQTAISQVECIDIELDSFFNDIIFKVGDEKLTIATTRPELLPACVSVFYHPEDKRYQHLKGKMAKVPLFNHEVPIMEDERADPEKGTGIVMCCTFGDSTDMEWQKAHNLPIKEAIGKDGNMTALAGKYEGMKIEEARKAIIADMKTEGLLTAQKPIKHAVNAHERCDTPIEFVHSKQWFIKYLDLKDDMLRWGGEFNWFPHHMKNRYDNWVQGLQWDWCVSRQIYFGIPIPVWYCKKCDAVVAADEKDLPVDPLEDAPPVDKCPKCGCTEFEGESDILNTWATSSLTPTIVKELFKGKLCYDELISNPMSLRPQGHDIISFWLFNTVVKSYMHFEMKPWNDCFINGWMLDPKGKKMSKSKGNVIEPQMMIQKYCADALRYLAGSSKLGDDLSFQEKEMVTGQKMVNKVWNATRFAIMGLEGFDPSTRFEDVELRPMDRWALSKLQKVITDATESFEKYEYSKAFAVTTKLFWGTICDNYLEFCKDRLYNPESRGEEQKLAAQFTLYHLFNDTLKMIAPIMPHITESVYQLHFVEKEGVKSIHLARWPEVQGHMLNEQAEVVGDILVDIIGAVRKFKSENKVSLKAPVKLTIECDEEHKEKIQGAQKDLTSTANATELIFGTATIQLENHENIKVAIELVEEEKKEQTV
ncbi:MAG: valine--tRNA ligase [Candidatus Woesearchaeota archaeon]